jgi:hypothetical protein
MKNGDSNESQGGFYSSNILSCHPVKLYNLWFAGNSPMEVILIGDTLW